MNRAARSFVALLTVGSVACSGRACGGADSVPIGTASTNGSASAEELTTAQTAPPAEQLDQAVQSFGLLLSNSRDGEKISPTQARERLQRLYGLLDTAGRALPRDTFDLAAVVGQVGRDPVRLRDWVSRETSWVPYRGALRDALGTLMDRTGNSLDRALLLARLIQEAGGQVRLARARLSSAQATALFERLERRGPPTTAPTEATELELGIFAQQSGVAPDVIRARSQQVTRLATGIRDDVQARVKAQTSAIARMVGLTDQEEPVGAARNLGIEALQDHWWVQWQGSATWVDLDPATDGASQVVVKAQQTLDPGQLPADLRHEVEIRVVVERWDGSQLTESLPVGAVVRPSETIGLAIEFRQAPMAWPRDLVPGSVDASRGLRNAVLGQHEWLPILKIGTRTISRASFLDTGDLNDRPGSRRGPVASGFLDALAGGGDETPPGVLTAEWLEYEIRTPGLPARTIRREIFDLVGPAARAARHAVPELSEEDRWRRGLSLLGETEILLVANHLSAPFVAFQGVSRLQTAQPMLESLAADETPSALSVDERLSRVPQRMPGPLHELASARQNWGQPPGLLYIAQPNIFARHVFPTGGLDGPRGIAEAIDLVANEIDVRPADRSVQLARLEQGVLDANLEAVLLGPTSGRLSTADSFGSGEQTEPWVTVRTPEDLARLALVPDLRARIETALRGGYVALVARPGTEGTTKTGWWRIDPRTGSALAVGNRGWGQAMTEKITVSVLVGLVTFQVCMWVATGRGEWEGATKWDYVTCVLTSAGAGVGTWGATVGVALGPQLGVLGPLFRSILTGALAGAAAAAGRRAG